MKVTFRKVTESKIPKEPKPNEKDLNRKTTTGEFTNDPLETPKKKVANKAEQLIPKKLKGQKTAKQVVERNEFTPEGPDGYDEPLEDTDNQIQLAATHNTTNPIAESGIVILSFEQFLNEAEDFKTQFEPHAVGTDADVNEPEETDDTSDIPSAEAPDDDTEEEPKDDTEEEPKDDNDWYIGDNGAEPDEQEPGAPEEMGDDLDKTQTELESLNKQITEMLKKYKDGKMNMQQYKDQSSPLLAKRKELQSKMDSAFNMSLDGSDETGEGTPDGNIRF